MSLIKTVGKIRPVLRPTSDASAMAISLTLERGSPPFFSESLALLKSLRKTYELLLIFDEFQEITRKPRLDARFRGELQELNETPVILTGSKQHLLQDFF